MKHVVITGSTRGIGLGLAKEFLEAGCKVTINGQTELSVQSALDSLKECYSKQMAGFFGKVEDREEMENLWNFAVRQFGAVDIWINNAGIDQERKLVWEMDKDEYEKVIKTNIIGVINGSSVAFKHMIQQGKGQIFNMEGFGSNGMMREKMTIYGTSKSAVSYFTRSLAIEAKNTPIKVGTLSPGMVATDFLKNSIVENDDEAKRSKKIFNILADHVEPVTQFLAHRVLENKENNAKIEWLTKPKVIWRFISSPFFKREIFK
ncbi:MAG: SDR family oxidoreductase [Bacillota bacterium]|nr:SDR family oxidoreductase [Bacillota bacterium]